MDMDPVTLRFRSAIEEGRYRVANERGLRIHSIVAIFLGLALYLAYGVAEPVFSVPGWPELWRIRLTAVPVPVLAIVLLFVGGRLQRWRSPITAVAGLSAIIAISLMAHRLPQSYAMYYVSGIILGVVWLYLCAGVGFLTALVSNVFVLIWVNALWGLDARLFPYALFNYNFFLMASSILSGYGAYQLERRRRLLFRHAQQITHQRNRHRHAASVDPLTGLLNRRTLEKRLGQLLQASVRNGKLGAVIFLDLDHFKPVNDAWGHALGDSVLRMIAARLKHSVRNTDVVGRFGGDEFLVILPTITDREAAVAAAEKMVAAIGKPLAVERNGHPTIVIELGASIGICLFPDQGDSVQALLLKADNAMYEAKHRRSTKPIMAE